MLSAARLRTARFKGRYACFVALLKHHGVWCCEGPKCVMMPA